MNLTDFEQTPIHRVFEAVRSEAARYGAAIVGSEIVGLVPRKAIEMTAEWFIQAENYRPELVLENRLEAASGSGLDEFLDALAAPTPTPGGGSAAAASAAMSAALGAMIAALAKTSPAAFEADRKFFAEAVNRDAAAYQEVVAAYKRPKDERAPWIEKALHSAAKVPLEVAERSAALKSRLERLGTEAPAKFGSDVQTAEALAQAAINGALANVRINLESIKDDGYRSNLTSRIGKLQ
jgi:formiminotetrahydrofolate cyclodeaminase